MGKQVRQPQDRKPKGAVDKLRAEAKQQSAVEDLAGRPLIIRGRNGEVTVTTLADPLDWDAEVLSFLREGDYMSAIIGMLSTEDGQRLRAVRPSLASVMAVVMGDEEDEDESEPSLGESHAS